MKPDTFFRRKRSLASLSRAGTVIIFTGLLTGCLDTDLKMKDGVEPRTSATDSAAQGNGDRVPANDSDPDPQDGSAPTPRLSLAGLGEKIFNDTNLSSPQGQSCASCHSESSGFTDPDMDHPSSLGANGGDFGKRNTPTIFYVSEIPELQTVVRPDPVTQVPTTVDFGGFFVDGRAATLEEQAKLPLFDPLEMALPSTEEFLTRVQGSDYAEEFTARFGAEVFDSADATLDAAATAMAAFQRTSRFAPFNSKFDKVKAGEEIFTASETRGELLFNGKALCSSCHLSPEGPEVFSDFLYHNIGTPKNPTLLNNIGDETFVDLGRGAITNDPVNAGQFRTPTLRNIAITPPYMHNGVFTTLREVVEFYNEAIEAAEVPGDNISPFVGNLLLSDTDIDDLVAFMETLTDQ